MSAWGFWLQAVGTVIIFGGLLWTWASWSRSDAATAMRRVASRIFHRPTTLEVHASQQVMLSDNVSLVIQRGRPAEDTRDVLPWVEYLERLLADEARARGDVQARTEQRMAQQQQRHAAAIADLRADMQREAKSRDEQMVSVTLSGIGVAAGGTLLSLIGMFLSAAA